MEQSSDSAPELTTLLMRTRFRLPTEISLGPRIRVPSRKNIGEFRISRMVTPVNVMSSHTAPSTVSSANPRQLSKTQFEMVMFLKPPFDSVPHLILPVGCLNSAPNRLKLPSSKAPNWYPPVT